MNKNSKCGMTTVELILVISLIAMLLLIAIPAINNAIKCQKNGLYNVQIENIKKGAIVWGSSNLYLMPANNGDSIAITLGELESKGFVEKNIVNPKTEQEFADNVLVVITKKNNSYLYTVENVDSADQNFDKDAPYIILSGRATEYVEINGTYAEKGIQARDKDGKEITSITTYIKKNDVTVSDITTNQMSTYVITYVATDIANGKSSSVHRNVIVRDTMAPIIMVYGINTNYTMTVKKDSSFVNPTAVVVDNSGEEITPTIKGSVNTSVEGNYELIYEAKDKNNNVGRLILTALVKNVSDNVFINYSSSTSLWTNQDVTMTIMAIYDNSLPNQTYSFDGGSSWQSSSSKSFASNQVVNMQARDITDKKSSIVTYSITNIDKILPTCNITGSPTSWVDSADLTITGSDSESGVDGIKKPGSSEYLSVTSTSATVTNNGTYTANVKDVAGNIGSCSASVTKIDNASPTCTITGNPTSWTTGATLTITGSDSQSGVVGIKKPGDSDYTSTTNSTTFNVTGNGNYMAYVTDASGRVGTCSVDVTKVDNTNPSTPTVTLKLDTTGGADYTSGTWTNHTVVQIPTATDTESGINKYQYSNDTTTWYDMTNPRSITNEENQTYYVRAIDNAGHISATSTSHNIKIDKTNPVLTVPSNITLYDNQVSSFNTMTGASATDNSGLTPTITVSGTVNASAGTYTLVYKATDAAGNEATGNRTVTVLASTPVIYTFAYTGAVQNFTVPTTGNYLVQVWGAQGGSSTVSDCMGGNGGYATGYLSLTAGQSIDIYVGGAGVKATSAEAVGGWNGGGSSPGSNQSNRQSGSGGGATDVRIGGTALENRVIVAGGGGGGGSNLSGKYGGPGGGLTGLSGGPTTSTYGGTGGTQSAGGYYGGVLGTGGYSIGTSSVAGGGGGYYGGGSGKTAYMSGGGGSSYIGGVTNGSTIAGDASMPNPAGGTMTGKIGSGYAILTFQP